MATHGLRGVPRSLMVLRARPWSLRTGFSHKAFESTANAPPSHYKEPEPTSFDKLNMSSPSPSTAIDSCGSHGFTLNNAIRVTDGSGIMLIGGEAFKWRPWLTQPDKNAAAQAVWDVKPEAWGLLSLVSPRPDILVIGTGLKTRPLAKGVREHLSSLGIRIEMAATAEAAATYNLLATERGVKEVAAALLPMS